MSLIKIEAFYPPCHCFIYIKNAESTDFHIMIYECCITIIRICVYDLTLFRRPPAYKARICHCQVPFPL